MSICHFQGLKRVNSSLALNGLSGLTPPTTCVDRDAYNPDDRYDTKRSFSVPVGHIFHVEKKFQKSFDNHERKIDVEDHIESQLQYFCIQQLARVLYRSVEGQSNKIKRKRQYQGMLECYGFDPYHVREKVGEVIYGRDHLSAAELHDKTIKKQNNKILMKSKKQDCHMLNFRTFQFQDISKK